MVDVSQYNGKFHLASEPAPHVLLLEFNRSVDLFSGGVRLRLPTAFALV